MPLDSNSGPDYTGSFHGEMIGMTPREDFDPLAPQREAAMFYGLFLRGHSPETLRRDIDVPKVGRQMWKQRLHILTRAVPLQHAMHRSSVT